jgi:predicted metal-dependent hydrolase
MEIGDRERLPEAFYTALETFERQEYFECHEILEALWIPEKDSVREVYQGVLQIAVGCYHLTVRANWVGAVNKLDAGARRLEHAGLRGGNRYGVDWSGFLSETDRLLRHLHTLGRENVTRYDPALLPKIRHPV